jgi:paraquat-inducible protein A
VGRLWREGYLLLAAIILCFSVVFPVAKLVVLGTVCLLPLPDTTRHRAARWVGVLGRWSMLDVFVVAITIVLSTTSALGDVAPRAGLYVFTAAVLLTMVLGMSIERRCASPGPAPEPRPEGARGAAPPTPT